MATKLRTVAPLTAALLSVAALMVPAFIETAVGSSGRAPIRPMEDATFTTVFLSPLGLEGLTADEEGNLYSAGRGADPCPVWRISAAGGSPVVVGNVPAPCSPSGIAFDEGGRLYLADDDEVLLFTPDADAPATTTVFASGVPGANGIAFDEDGDLWVFDGTTGQGRVWRVGANGTPVEVFRIQPVANEVNLVGGVGGVGRDVRTLPPGTVTITATGRSGANTAGSQPLVANGLAFDEHGTLFVGDTARGAIWGVEFDRRGTLRSPVGCDTTFAANTLCLANVLAAHPYLEGVDGIALDDEGNIWVAANERNAIVVVTDEGQVVEFFRNRPDATSRLRNTGPLETPTSPFLVGRRLCITHSDGNRRDNSPNTEGEVKPAGPERAKISCLDQPLPAEGLSLPV